MKKICFLSAVLTLFLSSTGFAQRTSDIDTGKDYPLVSRFRGSVIEWYEHKNFNTYFILEKQDQNLVPKEIDGEIIRIQYSAGKDHSITEIARSYETALKNAGFTLALNLDEHNSPSNLNEQLYFGEFDGLNKLPGGSIKPDHNGAWSYLEAMGEKDGKDIYIVIYITNHDFPLITFDAVEVKKMESGLVTAQNIDKGISSAGHITLAGIYFDTGKSTIKPESDKALANIAVYLKAHPGKKYLIVGHTDNVGDFASNLTLSTDRAEAVAAELTAKYGIDPAQLTPYGVAFAAPVASNASDAGRARNRRVELVEQ